MHNKPWIIIQSLEGTSSRLAKESIVTSEAANGNAEFFAGAKLALDSMITFGIKQVPEKTHDDGVGLSWADFLTYANNFSSRELTGNAARDAVAHMMTLATQSQWNYWYRRILIKDLRCGVNEKTINNVVEKSYPQYAVPVFTCQLAHDSANYDGKLAGKKIIEVKLDGVRVIAIVRKHGMVNLYSRNGKELVNFPHIEQQLAKFADLATEDLVLDGEVMSASFQDLMKQVHRKSDVQSQDAVLNLFDIITLREFSAGIGTATQQERSLQLTDMYGKLADAMPNVTVVGQELVDLDTEAGQQRFSEINAHAIAGGYEGIMIKEPTAVYECKRSTSWLKMKPFIEVSLEIKHVEEGTKRNTGKLGAFVCEGIDDGRQIMVNVGSGFTDSDRDVFWSHRDNVVGQIVEVRADAVTQNQDGSYSLRFPRFLRFRGFEIGEKL